MSGTVTAEIRFINPEWKHRNVPPVIGDRASRRTHTTKHKVAVEDARGTEPDLDTTGFTLTRHKPSVTDFGNEPVIKSTYYEEVAGVVKRLVGADEVFVTHHLLRTEAKSDFLRAYARFAHCDYDITAPGPYSERALAERREALDASRDWQFAWYNTWQPIDRAAIRNPLALVDARSIDARDILPYHYSGSYAAGRGSMPLFSLDLRFWYVPRMTEDEMLVIKQLDTRPGRALVCPHTSFEIETPPGTPARRSIEVRMVCAFAS